MKLEQLFDVKNGLASSAVEVLSKPVLGAVPYIRPASKQQRTIAGWVQKASVGQANIYPSETLFVSTDGEGSHTYAYVARFEFIPNSNVSVLIPKREMSLQEKVFYARCITMNRYRFSYGRKPKGDRLKQIELPDTAPVWVNEIPTNNLWKGLERIKELSAIPAVLIKDVSENKLVRVQNLFDVHYGHSLELNSLVHLSKDAGGIPFVSRVMGNNGVSAYVAPIEGLVPTLAGVLSCALGGNGVLSTFLQEEPFYSGRDLAYLKPLVEMSYEELLYYCSCIWQNRYRFSYGRQANRTLKDLLIPAYECIPTWVQGGLARVTDQLLTAI
jgi:hypothetical protein